MSTNAQPLAADTWIVQTSGHLASDMNGEKVLLSIGSGNYYNLGRVGGRIWELAGQPVSIGKIEAVLLGEYDVEASACRSELLAFVELMRRESLVRVGGAAGEPIA
ncbi:Coenzyme PQQ synthesis protein D (PqqD) [Paenibacillus sp. UNC496MF]|uniref:lasso peptide biosynthesis PqqD family chaperone n=1 Tax=Paenibacillus sp. UNC496MF TaxID=1502753 RepID=UPI0008E1EFBA|nr:lasso peptide biosynthesis PqqD family chaperone [Paenibacillus sp. UNC496MF]SFI88912.1 Coenzyme PQQ synthesis protein D (PqqD) [Paenibacillus sp. UNC496MF]